MNMNQFLKQFFHLLSSVEQHHLQVDHQDLVQITMLELKEELYEFVKLGSIYLLKKKVHNNYKK